MRPDVFTRGSKHQAIAARARTHDLRVVLQSRERGRARRELKRLETEKMGAFAAPGLAGARIRRKAPRRRHRPMLGARGSGAARRTALAWMENRRSSPGRCTRSTFAPAPYRHSPRGPRQEARNVQRARNATSTGSNQGSITGDRARETTSAGRRCAAHVRIRTVNQRNTHS